MISFSTEHGDIFESGAQALVNPVNCVGVMGGGLALEFKKRYPVMFESYVRACQEGSLRPGIVQWWIGGGGIMQASATTPFILNFPTKDDWKNPSEMGYITEGLNNLIEVVKSLKITSIAIPALGCGLGGLPWDQVAAEITKAFITCYGLNLKVMIYPPK